MKSPAEVLCAPGGSGVNEGKKLISAVLIYRPVFKGDVGIYEHPAGNRYAELSTTLRPWFVVWVRVWAPSATTSWTMGVAG